MAYLRNLTLLKVLNLENTKVSDKSLAYLKNFKSMEVVRLGNTQVSDEGIAHLTDKKKALERYLGASVYR